MRLVIVFVITMTIVVGVDVFTALVLHRPLTTTAVLAFTLIVTWLVSSASNKIERYRNEQH